MSYAHLQLQEEQMAARTVVTQFTCIVQNESHVGAQHVALEQPLEMTQS